VRVLVTGASGFIGKRVLDSVRRKGWTAVPTSRSGGTDIVAVDFHNPNSLNVLRNHGRVDAVIHCGGIAHRFGRVPDEEFERINVDGTLNIARFAAENGASHFVHISSVLVYGTHGVGISEGDGCSPRDPYAVSKLRSEDAAIDVGTETGMAVTVLRPAPVIGEGCKGNFARLIHSIDRGRFINIGDGTAKKSLIYVGDVADICTNLIEAKVSGEPEVFNITGGTITTGEIVRAIRRALRIRPSKFSVPAKPIEFLLSRSAKILPVGPVQAAIRSLETWLSDDMYSADKIAETYGIEPKTPVREAIELTVSAYKNKVVD
jgi:nucleoside-diphosphate-sugar epimerase